MTNSPAPQSQVPIVHAPTATEGDFYFVVTPGLEDITRNEIFNWWPENLPPVEWTLGRGGLGARLPLALGFEFNRVLKTPTRILLRLAQFGCRDFPKLFKKLSSFTWDEWVTDQTNLVFSVSTHGSRLRMKKRIEETCTDARKAFLKKRGFAGKSSENEVSIFVRLQDDICTISLDTSGEILHKRGLRALSSDAPLRESTAASLLFFLESFRSESQFSVGQVQATDSDAGAGAGEIQLVDPMTGGGTFLLEARDLYRPVTSRKFAFESFVPALKRIGESPKLSSRKSSQYSSFAGYETDEKTALAARENLKDSSHEFEIDIRHEDIFKAAALPAGRKRWLIANPPYGERIRIEGRLTDYYANLLAATEKVAQPERACFLFPQKFTPERLKLPKEWRLAAECRFANGGLPVMALIFERGIYSPR